MINSPISHAIFISTKHILFWVGTVVHGCTSCIQVRQFCLNIGLKSYFVVTQFPRKWQPKGITNLSSLEYMPARLNICLIWRYTYISILIAAVWNDRNVGPFQIQLQPKPSNSEHNWDWFILAQCCKWQSKHCSKIS